MGIDPKLFNEPPRPSDVECCYRDLIYTLRQAFAFTEWADASQSIVSETEHIMHDALLGTALLSLRNLDDFLKAAGRGADIDLDDVRKLGFSESVARIFTDEESRTVSQLFAHITANRNHHRAPKQPFALQVYLDTTVTSFDPILKFYADRISSSDVWQWEWIQQQRHQLKGLLAKQKKLDGKPEFAGLKFYVSGHWINILTGKLT